MVRYGIPASTDHSISCASCLCRGMSAMIAKCIGFFFNCSEFCDGFCSSKFAARCSSATVCSATSKRVCSSCHIVLIFWLEALPSEWSPLAPLHQSLSTTLYNSTTTTTLLLLLLPLLLLHYTTRTQSILSAFFVCHVETTRLCPGCHGATHNLTDKKPAQQQRKCLEEWQV